MAEVTLWFNPHCSKCRGADELLRDAGVDLDTVHYLDTPPSRAEIVRVLGLLGLDDPRGLMRTGEPVYAELGLAAQEGDALVDAMAEHPVLIERPVVIRGDRAVIARPPELLLALLAQA